jgi:hypothetical protein
VLFSGTKFLSGLKEVEILSGFTLSAYAEDHGLARGAPSGTASRFWRNPINAFRWSTFFKRDQSIRKSGWEYLGEIGRNRQRDDLPPHEKGGRCLEQILKDDDPLYGG